MRSHDLIVQLKQGFVRRSCHCLQSDVDVSSLLPRVLFLGYSVEITASVAEEPRVGALDRFMQGTSADLRTDCAELSDVELPVVLWLRCVATHSFDVFSETERLDCNGVFRCRTEPCSSNCWLSLWCFSKKQPGAEMHLGTSLQCDTPSVSTQIPRILALCATDS